MAFGDVFQLQDINGFSLADFAKRCGIARSLLKREVTKIANNALKYAKKQAMAHEYTDDENEFVLSLSEFIIQQAIQLKELANEAAQIDDSFL